MESLGHMPLLQKYLVNEGTTFSNHYCTVALCCPSRVNLLTGKTAHNTNVCRPYSPITVPTYLPAQQAHADILMIRRSLMYGLRTVDIPK